MSLNEQDLTGLSKCMVFIIQLILILPSILFLILVCTIHSMLLCIRDLWRAATRIAITLWHIIDKQWKLSWKPEMPLRYKSGYCSICKLAYNRNRTEFCPYHH